MADSVGLALLVVLDTLAPAERLAFVLHEMFALPFDEIATIVSRSPAAARQLASRARRRIRAAKTDTRGLTPQREVVDAFLGALRTGDFQGLMAVLDPGLVVRSDFGPPGVPREIRGAEVWARGAVTAARLARFAQPALINGAVGLVFAPRGQLQRAIRLTIEHGRIAQLQIIADSASLRELEISVLSD
jgi:RNA polymerase sigma-70 factor (ECF subfamily)